MSSLNDKCSSPTVSEETRRARRGLSRIKEQYGSAGLERLKSAGSALDVMHCYRCPAAIASGKEYDIACCEMGLNDVHARAAHGFAHGLGEKPSNALADAWKELLRKAA